jgi:hypothetical protein
MDGPTARGRLCQHRWSLEAGGVEHSEEVGVEDASIGIPKFALRCAHAPAFEPDGAAEGVQPPTQTGEGQAFS